MSDSFFRCRDDPWGARVRPPYDERPTMNDHPRASATRAMPWRVRYLRKSIRARAMVKAPTKKYKVTA